MSMRYEKDIFRNFAYDFELSHKNEILASARTKSANADEIFGYASDEIKSTHPASSRISSNEVGFHRCRRFHPPARVDLVKKPTSRNLSVFLAESVRFELTVGRPITSFQDWLLKPLGQLSMPEQYTILKGKCQAENGKTKGRLQSIHFFRILFFWVDILRGDGKMMAGQYVRRNLYEESLL